jgi:hypothetical protein
MTEDTKTSESNSSPKKPGNGQADRRASSQADAAARPAARGSGPRTVSGRVTALLADYDALTDQERQVFFRQAGLVVLHTFRRTAGPSGTRFDYVKYQDHLYALLNPLAFLLNSIERYRALVSGGRATPTLEDYELLGSIAVKGFDELGRPQELRVFEEIVAAIQAKTQLFRDRETELRKSIPSRTRRTERQPAQQEAAEQEQAATDTPEATAKPPRASKKASAEAIPEDSSASQSLSEQAVTA